MTDTGPDLALAVARVVRPDDDAYVRTDQQGVHTCWIDPGNGLAYEWRPDLPGADFDEALEFAQSHMWAIVIDIRGGYCEVMWTRTRTSGWQVVGEKGGNYRIAVCRAIVAWRGENGQG